MSAKQTFLYIYVENIQNKNCLCVKVILYLHITQKLIPFFG